MANRPRRKSDAARRANQVIRGRTMLVMVLLGVATFTVLFMKLYDLQINQYDTLHARAVGQQTDSSVISASRGTIYDKNGEIMAISYSAETVYVDPHQIQLFVESQQEDIQAAAEKAAENGETYTAPEVLDQAYIARGLSRSWRWMRTPSWSSWTGPATNTGWSKARWTRTWPTRSAASSTARSTRRATS